MILIHRLKKIKLNKSIREILIDIVFFITFFFFGVYFVFSKVIEREERALILKNIDTDSKITEINVADDVIKGKFVASSRGKYFYPVGSSKANSLAEQNKVYFDTEEEAKKQGFKPYNAN